MADRAETTEPRDIPQPVLLAEIAALQQALNVAGWEIVKLRAELGLNPYHVEVPHER